MAHGRELPPAATVPLFTRFRAFWHEVDAARATVTRSQMPVSHDDTALVSTDGAIRARLLGFLKAQEAEVSRTAHGTVPPEYREAHYLMAAVADDIFIRLPWKGAASWIWRPLELELYGTRCAGDEVFERIERLTAVREPVNRELAAVYLVSLALGFEGRFAGRDRSPLEEYRRQLQVLVAAEGESLEGPLIPDCYGHTIAAGRGALLPNVRGWWWAAVVVAVLWLLGSTLMWRQVTGTIASAAARIDTSVAGGSR